MTGGAAILGAKNPRGSLLPIGGGRFPSVPRYVVALAKNLISIRPIQMWKVVTYMAQSLAEWIESDVQILADRSPAWLAQHHFFRDPYRPRFVDRSYFFSPADGIILYQKVVKPDSQLVEFKSERYTLQDAMRDPAFHSESLVIGIFMTFFDVHTNRIPYSGYLAYRELEPIGTYNRPMIAMENAILEDLRIDLNEASYLRQNQRMINRIYSPRLRQSYYVLQIADFDVDCILPYRLSQNMPFGQGERFSQIRHGSQVELVIPLTHRYDLKILQPDGCHVQAGLDPLVKLDVQHPPRINRRREGV